MIITSLNLYEFSMANNKEMGVLIDKMTLMIKNFLMMLLKKLNSLTLQVKALDSNLHLKKMLKKALIIKRRFSKNQLQHLQIGLGIAYDVMKI